MERVRDLGEYCAREREAQLRRMPHALQRRHTSTRYKRGHRLSRGNGKSNILRAGDMKILSNE